MLNLLRDLQELCTFKVAREHSVHLLNLIIHVSHVYYFVIIYQLCHVANHMMQSCDSGEMRSQFIFCYHLSVMSCGKPYDAVM